MTKPRESGNGWRPNYIRQSAAAYHKAARQVSLDLKKATFRLKAKPNPGSEALAVACYVHAKHNIFSFDEDDEVRAKVRHA